MKTIQKNLPPKSVDLGGGTLTPLKGGPKKVQPFSAKSQRVTIVQMGDRKNVDPSRGRGPEKCPCC